MRFVPISEFEKEEQKAFRFIPIEEVESADATDYSDMATAMQGAPTGGPLIRSVMDQPGEVPRTPGFDPMLNQDYVAGVRHPPQSKCLELRRY